MPTLTRSLHVVRRARAIVWISVALVLSAGSARAADSRAVPMTPDRWQLGDSDAEFQTHRGVQALLIRKGVAIATGVTLGDGTIEFDVEPAGPMGAGTGFRRRDADTYEDFYLRPRPDCGTAWDCMQYAPRTHGVLLWDLYPQYQAPGTVRMDDWNHVKLVVSGRRLRV